MKEQSIQKKIIDYLDGLGAQTYKIISANKRGTPDIIACLNGRFVAIEVKAGRNKLSQLQEINIKRIQEAGGTALVAYDVNDVSKYFDKPF